MSTLETDNSVKVKKVELLPPRTTNANNEVYYDNNEFADEIYSIAEPLQEAPNILNTSAPLSMLSNRASMQRYLQIVPHLFTLSEKHLSELDVMVREYGELEIIIEEGQLLQHIYVLASGTVEVMNTKKGIKRAFGHRRVGSITAPNVFGIDNAILESPAEFTYHVSLKSTLLLIPKEKFIALFSQSPVFASSVSSSIVQTLPAFTIFKDFSRSIFGLSSASFRKSETHQGDGYVLPLKTLVGLYKQSETVQHRRIYSKEIDGEALCYCLRRLPMNITSTYIIVLASLLPNFLSYEFIADVTENMRTGVVPNTLTVDTGRRRRCAWTFAGGGQTLIMMRDGFTDPIDFVSTLCMLIVESRKICMRLEQLVAPSAIEILREELSLQMAGGDSLHALERLPFSPRERDALKRAWGSNVVLALYNVLQHREEYVVCIGPNVCRQFLHDPYTTWGLSIVLQIKKALGLPGDANLPTDIVVDILFSSNRVLKNCFCAMGPELKKLVASKSATDGVEATTSRPISFGAWRNPTDRYYYTLTTLLEKDVALRRCYRASLESNGFTIMEDVDSSALIVDLIDVRKINLEYVDPALIPYAETAMKEANSSKPHFIINVDKTFGAQVETILRSLLLSFGTRIRSVNLFGKAAGLQGNHGDVVLPSQLLFSKRSFGEDSCDEIRNCNQASLEVEDIEAFFGKSSPTVIHRGVCVTLPGFILQNLPAITFYRVVHGATTFEMQSSYVARQLEECHRTGVLPHGVTSRYLFYMDDMLLAKKNSSYVKAQRSELLTTLYASTRALLSRILIS
ncbi:unnamed protein product [Phytomonas sp. Hart1]|nr:unnamed protein product [Phytomonas sp. Hart1]|eukprot:CCW70239.1 unnamed protein product [Phytomonas sp. isolate Hart1]